MWSRAGAGMEIKGTSYLSLLPTDILEYCIFRSALLRSHHAPHEFPENIIWNPLTGTKFTRAWWLDISLPKKIAPQKMQHCKKCVGNGLLKSNQGQLGFNPSSSTTCQDTRKWWWAERLNNFPHRPVKTGSASKELRLQGCELQDLDLSDWIELYCIA